MHFAKFLRTPPVAAFENRNPLNSPLCEFYEKFALGYYLLAGNSLNKSLSTIFEHLLKLTLLTPERLWVRKIFQKPNISYELLAFWKIICMH